MRLVRTCERQSLLERNEMLNSLEEVHGEVYNPDIGHKSLCLKSPPIKFGAMPDSSKTCLSWSTAGAYTALTRAFSPANRCP